MSTETARPNRGGRPAVGPAVTVRIPADMLARVDAAAAAQGTKRAEWIRRAVENGLG